MTTCDRKGCSNDATMTILSETGFPQDWYCAAHYAALLPVDIAWIDDNDGCGPRKLQNSIRCF